MAKKKRKPIRHKPPTAHARADQNNQVHLKPFLGMSPGLYLTILYALAVLIILFLLLFYKGLRDRGEYLRVNTFPPGASVRVDGRYAGSSPFEVLVKKGSHTITVNKPHYTTYTLEREFRGPVFATLFVRPRRELKINLELHDPAGLTRDALKDLSANPQIPEILTETVWGGANSPNGLDQLNDFIDKSKYFVTNPFQLYSYLYAWSSLDADVKTMTPASLLASVTKIIRLNEKYENSPFWLATVLPEEARQKLLETSWFAGRIAFFRNTYQQLQGRLKQPGAVQTGTGRAIAVRNMRFFHVPSGELLQGSGEDGLAAAGQLPHPVVVPSFLMSETETSNREYRAFIEENPQWRPENKAELVKQGLADEQYLASWQVDATDAGWEDLPVTGVSFYASQAFCRWLDSKLPPSLSGYTARLPFESEWEWAARGGLVGADYPGGRPSEKDRFFAPDITGPSPVGSSSPNGYGLRDMTGNVWEWCVDWYSPVAYLFTSWSADNNDFDSSREIPFGAEKVIRGGSWANKQELVKVSTRGSQPPGWCTPYLGFRVILSRHNP
jgi:iron(II)-dependent oxidoreductase